MTNIRVGFLVWFGLVVVVFNVSGGGGRKEISDY